MQQLLKLSFKNTLWFLIPSSFIFLIIIALNVHWNFRGVAAWVVFRDSYYFLLLPNIPFFIASIVLFAFPRDGVDRTTLVFVTNGVAIGVWFLTLYISNFIIHLGDIGFGGILLLAIAILALVVFFIRSIVVKL